MGEGPARRERGASAAALLLLAVAVALNHMAFAVSDHAGPNWDATCHLDLGLEVLGSLRSSQTPLEAVRVLYDRGTTYYPPLVYLVAAAFHQAFGPSLRSALGSNLVFLLVLLASAWALGRRLWGASGGLLAGFLAVTSAGVLGWSQVCYQDLPLAATVMLHLALLHAADRFRRPGISALAGAALGLAMLTKPNAWVFVGPAWLLLAPWRAERRRWLHMVLSLACALLVAGPWYSLHGPHILEMMRDQVNPDAVRLNAGRPGHWMVGGIQVHLPAVLGNLAHVLVPAPVFLLFLAQCAAMPWRRELRTGLPLLACLLGGLALLSVFPAYDPRYLVPLVPMVAVLAGWWATLPARVAVPVVALLLATGAVQMVAWTPPLSRALEGREPLFHFYRDTLGDDLWPRPTLFSVRLPQEGPNQVDALFEAVGPRPTLWVALCHGYGNFYTGAQRHGTCRSSYFMMYAGDGRVLEQPHTRSPLHPATDLARVERVAVPETLVAAARAGTLEGWPAGLDLRSARLLGTYEVPALCSPNPRMLLYGLTCGSGCR